MNKKRKPRLVRCDHTVIGVGATGFFKGTPFLHRQQISKRKAEEIIWDSRHTTIISESPDEEMVGVCKNLTAMLRGKKSFSFRQFVRKVSNLIPYTGGTRFVEFEGKNAFLLTPALLS